MPGVMPAGVSELVLSPGVQSVDFVSDLHLHPSLPQTVAAFEAWLATTSADALFILGDLFEVWVGDDALAQPFEARCAAALRAISRSRPVYLLHGNRDFLLGPRFFEATGITLLADPCVLTQFGQRVLLSHGDELCVDDTAYQAFRRQVRQPAWQAAFLARSWEERQAIANQMRQASREHQREPQGYADVDPVMAEQWLQTHRATVLVHGHTHRPGTAPLPSGALRHVLSDWDLDGQHGSARAEVMRWTAYAWTRTPPR